MVVQGQPLGVVLPPDLRDTSNRILATGNDCMFPAWACETHLTGHISG